eukprot:CAMPEP_0201731004 /NCGR_PEP_ID=MMETSP0593-20130828/24319_1 /ASSEMBLY_ACC=CAM_ASM_000672 /TAXON_ID=267983 /ORGANISM="Skeletonema japonicum, Strain CCMP2506" /LENGTH=34 /DNA_ID= /DNA_START= /DNA_END= /DNA_ORIENTATION=
MTSPTGGCVFVTTSIISSPSFVTITSRVGIVSPT